MSEDEAPMTNDERYSEIDRRAAGGDPRPPKPPPLQFGIKALLGMMVAVGVIFGTLRWIGAAERTSYLVLGILLVSLPAAAALIAVIARIGGDDE
jgi:hypothetical protein